MAAGSPKAKPLPPAKQRQPKVVLLAPTKLSNVRCHIEKPYLPPGQLPTSPRMVRPVPAAARIIHGEYANPRTRRRNTGATYRNDGEQYDEPATARELRTGRQVPFLA